MISRLCDSRKCLAAMLIGLCVSSSTHAQLTTFYTEDFEGIELGSNVDEGLIADDPRDEVWDPDGPEGWTVDRSGTPEGGVIEFRGWNFVDPIWWSEVAEDQDRSLMALEAEFVVAVADGDEWDDAAHEPGTMNTFMSTPPIDVAGLGSTSLEFLSSWRPFAEQTATVEISYDGGAPVEVLRYESNEESDFFVPDTPIEDVSVEVDVPAGAQSAVISFGYTNAGNDWWWAIDNIAFGDYEENFEDVILGPNVQEGRATPAENVWSKDGPDGWEIEDDVPGQDEDNDNNGVTEWIGWNFADKDWWVGVAGDQRRGEFTNGEGTVAIADSDEWDDAPHPAGDFSTFISSEEISIEGVEPGTIELQFDSSWRPYAEQTATVEVSFDGGPNQEVMLWESLEDSEFFKDDASTNDTITVDIDNPAGASTMVITWGYASAANDWFWAIDNIAVAGVVEGGGIACDFDGSGALDIGDIDELLEAINVGANDSQFDITGDGSVNQADINALIQDSDKFNTWVGDANLDGEFSSADLVVLFAAGEYEDDVADNSTWATGDFTGDGDFTSSDLVAAFSGGGYEQGPRAATAAVPEPASFNLLIFAGLLLVRVRRGQLI